MESRQADRFAHPAVTLALVKVLRQGAGIAAGQVITAGSYTGLCYAEPGEAVAGTFAGFGHAAITLTA